MRIVYVAPFGLGQKTTVWARILPLARHLAANGDQVTVLIPPWDTPEDAGRSWIDHDVRVVNVDLVGGLPSVVGRLVSQLMRSRPEIVHILKPRAYAGIVQWLLWYRRRFAGQTSYRIFLDVDDWEASWSAISGYTLPVARFLDWQERWGYSHTDGITAASRWLTEQAGQLAPGIPCLYLPNGIEPAERPVQRAEREAHRPDRVLYFGRFVEFDVEWMVSFWAALKARRPGVELVLAGKAVETKTEVAILTRLVAADPQVRWQGYVSRDQLTALYTSVDCAIFPAAPTPLSLAKCSVRLATTLLHGVPVVASAVGEQAQYGGEGAAYLVESAAPASHFAQAVVEVLSDPARQRLLLEQARRRLLTRYDWARLSAELATFYRSGC